MGLCLAKPPVAEVVKPYDTPYTYAQKQPEQVMYVQPQQVPYHQQTVYYQQPPYPYQQAYMYPQQQQQSPGVGTALVGGFLLGAIMEDIFD